MTVARKQVSIALTERLKTAWKFNYTSRRFRSFADLSGCAKPALLVLQKPEQAKREMKQTDALRVLNFEAWVFIGVGSDPNTVPIDTLDDILDAIDPQNGGVLKADAPGVTNRCTLGGLVYDCYISGTIDKVSGDIDGVGAIFIPITVIYQQAG